MSWSKHNRPSVVVIDDAGAVHVGTDVRFQLERSGLRRRTFECAYLRDSLGAWVRIGPIREMSFT